MTADELEQKLRGLRTAFDASFAEPEAVKGDPALDFLAIAIAGDPYAVRLSEVTGLYANRKLVKTPSLLQELSGLAGFRGALTPVYDLGALIGYPAVAKAKWLVLAKHSSPIGLLFETFDTHLRVPPNRLAPAEPGRTGSVRETVRHGSLMLPVLHLPSIIDGVARKIQALGPS